MRYSLIALLAVVSLVGLAGCDHGNAAAATGAGGPPPTMVTAIPAEARDVPLYLNEIGKTVAREVVTIQPQVSGRVTEVHFEDGAEVKKGDLLFTIDPRPFEAAVAQAQATLSQSQENSRLAHLELTRWQAVKDTKAVSEADLDQKESAVAVAEAQIKAAEAALETAKLNLEYCTIRSPIDGRTGHRLVDPGNIVSNTGTTGSGTSLLVIQRLDPIYADFTVTENDLSKVRQFMADAGKSEEAGLKVEVDVPSGLAAIRQAVLAAQAGNPATQAADQSSTSDPKVVEAAMAAVGAHPGPRQGMLSFLDNSVQDGTGTVMLRATVKNPDRYFWPGQFVNVRLILAMQKDAVLVPTEAIQLSQQGQFVYVVKEARGPDGKTATVADQRLISVGQRQGDQTVIEHGVNAGEQVVVTGQMMVQPGAPIMVALGQSPAPAAGPTTKSGQASAQ